MEIFSALSTMIDFRKFSGYKNILTFTQIRNRLDESHKIEKRTCLGTTLEKETTGDRRMKLYNIFIISTIYTQVPFAVLNQRWEWQHIVFHFCITTDRYSERRHCKHLFENGSDQFWQIYISFVSLCIQTITLKHVLSLMTWPCCVTHWNSPTGSHSIVTKLQTWFRGLLYTWWGRVCEEKKKTKEKNCICNLIFKKVTALELATCICSRLVTLLVKKLVAWSWQLYLQSFILPWIQKWAD